VAETVRGLSGRPRKQPVLPGVAVWELWQLTSEKAASASR
jgi:hypothetical protein